MSRTATKRAIKGPQFVQYMGPILDVLRELGGSGRPSEVQEKISEKLSISDTEQTELLKSGQSRVSNRIHWARFYLVKAGFIDASERGVWSLTAKGTNAPMDHESALAIFRSIHIKWGSKADPNSPNENEFGAEPTVGPEDDTCATMGHRERLLAVLKELPPVGFERLCQRLLRETGFEHVHVTGRSGDGGIDGNGLLVVNHLVSFRVLFQSKRYAGSVGSSQVRDFRGAMQGRADKGLIITTGTFTRDAKLEASRDGVPPIELIDGERLLDLFEKLQLGLKPRQTYDVDEPFFEEFMIAGK